jgi:hypothetical protein
MSCYRQFIRGYNFHKEGYVHSIMMDILNISTENPLCYLRSKCFASMKKEVYTQWIRRTIDMYHNCDTPNFPFFLGGGNKKIRIFNYLLWKETLFYNFYQNFINFKETSHKRSYLKCLAGKLIEWGLEDRGLGLFSFFVFVFLFIFILFFFHFSDI